MGKVRNAIECFEQPYGLTDVSEIAALNLFQPDGDLNMFENCNFPYTPFSMLGLS
jgi:hypothetical protein